MRYNEEGFKMKRKISMILVLVLVIGTLLPSMAFATPYKNLNMEQYELKGFHSRLFNDLPWGLAKRGEGNLPWGLQKRLEKGGIGYLPNGLTKEFHADNFELYVTKMILKYDREETEEIIEEIEELLLEDPIDEEAIEELLEELEETYLWYQFLDNVNLIIDRCGDLDEDLVDEIEDLMDDPANKDEIEDLIEELEELCDCQEYIDEVNGILDDYDANQSIRDAVEELLEDCPVDRDAVQVILDQLIEDYENYEEAMEEYEDLVEEIEEFLDGDLTGFGNRATYNSFIDTFELWNDLDDPEYAELLEAIGVLEALLDYLDDMFTITEGIAVLEDYKDDMEDILEDPEFTTGEGFGLYFPIVETTFDEYIEEIEDLTDPTLFDIIVLISEVEGFLDIYEEMRYITTDEYDDYVDMRDEVLVDLEEEIADLDDEDLDLLFEEFESLADDLDDEDYITLAQYNNFIEKYEELMELYDDLD